MPLLRIHLTSPPDLATSINPSNSLTHGHVELLRNRLLVLSLSLSAMCQLGGDTHMGCRNVPACIISTFVLMYLHNLACVSMYRKRGALETESYPCCTLTRIASLWQMELLPRPILYPHPIPAVARVIQRRLSPRGNPLPHLIYSVISTDLFMTADIRPETYASAMINAMNQVR
jgi:hypothetical protein